MTYAVRFWQKVDIMVDGCWEWTAARDPKGYGRFGIGGAVFLAHRVAYELLVGPIPDGLQLDHLCRNTSCVRPDHLEPVTMAKNIRRGRGAELTRQRAACRKTCRHGHPWTAENTRVDLKGTRHCRACDLDARDRRTSQRAGQRVARLGFDPGPRARFYINQ